MAAPSNHFKLGLFVLLALAAAVFTVFGLGAALMHKETIAYHTYFNESVQGLDVGAPVKFRGVTIGAVSAVGIAPDHRHVDVVEELNAQEIRRMGLSEPAGPKSITHSILNGERFLVPPDLRAQLGSQGITGVKFVSIDFFDPVANPPPSLPFPVGETYIPAAPSVFKSLEDTLTKAMEKLPDLINSVTSVTDRLGGILSDLQAEGLPRKASQALVRADDVLLSVERIVKQVDQAKLPEKLAGSFEEFSKAVVTLNGALARLDGDAGLLASLRRASDAVGGLGRGAGAATRELDQTLREVREAAESIRRLTDDIDHEPDILLKGRAKAKRAPSGDRR